MILIAVTPSEITGTQLRISRSYMNALTQAGAVPVLLPLTFDETLEDRVLEDFVDKRYASFTTGIGAEYVEGKIGLAELEAYALEKGEVTNVSGRQELLETIVNDYIYEN